MSLNDAGASGEARQGEAAVEEGAPEEANDSDNDRCDRPTGCPPEELEPASHPPTTSAVPKKMNVVERAPTSLASVEMLVSSASGYAAATTAGR